MNKSTSRMNGFTIVELLIVIVVIAILATISVVAYRGVQERAKTSAVTSALSQASTKLEVHKTTESSYPTNLSDIGISDSDSLKYEYTVAGDGNYCLTAVNGDISYYLASPTKKITAGGCNGHTWPSGVVLTNMVTNGDFSQGTSGWEVSNANPIEIIDGAARTLPTSNLTNTTGTQHIYQTIQLVQSRKYYIRADMFGDIKLGLTTYDYPSTSGNLWSTTSLIQISTINGIRAVGVKSSKSSGWTLIATKAFSMIDLTAAFGAGKEPSKEQMDQIMAQFPNSWFDGTVTANTRGIL